MLRDFIKKQLGERKPDEANKIWQSLSKGRDGYFKGARTAGKRKIALLQKIMTEVSKKASSEDQAKYILKVVGFTPNLKAKELTGILSAIKSI